MAKPQKGGISYFPLDVDNDDKLDLIEAEFGLTGFAVVVKLYQRIYKLGYYCEWNAEVALLFGKRIGLGGKAVSEIVSAALKRALFDRELYEKYGILTSRGIQKRYFEITSRRKRVEIDQRYLLVPCDILQHDVNIMYAETQIMSTSCTQKSEKCMQKSTKERKEKESKGNQSSGGSACARAREDVPPPPPPPPQTLESYTSGQLSYLSPTNMAELAGFMDGLPEDLIRYAIDEACAQGKRTWAYVRSILQRYLQAGFRSIGDVKAAEAARQRGKPRESGRSPANPALNYSQREHTDADYNGLFINLEEV